MKIKQIRNATLTIEYAGKKILVDPFLADKGTYPPFQNTFRQDMKNPIVELPESIDELIKVDAVIVTHLHLDHWDDVASERLPKNIKLYVQNNEDANIIREAGFKKVEVLGENTIFEGISLSKTNGKHGRGEVLNRIGDVCGVVFRHISEKTLYIAGDTVWCDDVQNAVNKYRPEIIVLNAGDNQYLGGISLVMGKDDLYEVYKTSPNSKIIASHMEAVNHWGLSREELKKFIHEKGIEKNVLVPNDGDLYIF